MNREGLCCWPWGDRHACSRTIEDRPLEGYESFMSRAGKEGWVIGHWDGQAYYCCPEHRDAVWDPVKLVGLTLRRTVAERRRSAVDRYKAAAGRRGAGRVKCYRHTRNFRFLTAKFRLGWAELRTRARSS